jgi:3-deoxy-manno-octulosonate cytidylyltransferase (CMP-KDO synthetase)
MKTLVIIPSRMSATRLPGKPLLKINGLSIISHVFKRAEKANVGEVVVATENTEIVDDVKKNGGLAVLTSNQHNTGTDRIYEALQKMNISNVDLIMNLQGDEPLIDINDIKNLKNKMIENNSELGTLASETLNEEKYKNQNVVKVKTKENLSISNFPEKIQNFVKIFIII